MSPTLESSVEEGCSTPDTCLSGPCPTQSTCQDDWDSHDCACKPGYIGDQCFDICQLDPCQNNGTCSKDQSDRRGYSCSCSSPLLSGTYCQNKVQQPCPANWWGYPVCGPCKCDVTNGFNPDCDKKTGECRCKDYHYQPNNTDVCLPCKCFPQGSKGQLCDPVTGGCECKPGVIGQLCDSCAHQYAEVTEHGCQVVYESCPKSYSAEVWWPRTGFGQQVEVGCPVGAEGTATRKCNPEQGWDKPDLFNCTHREMLPLFKDLAQLENREITMNSYLAQKTARNLNQLAASLDTLYGADMVLMGRLLLQILEWEEAQTGFNLSHRQERDFIRDLVNIASRLLQEENEVFLSNDNPGDRTMFNRILNLFKAYGRTLAVNLRDTYTNPFEITAPNLMFGLDTLETVQRRESGPHPQSRVQPAFQPLSSTVQRSEVSEYVSLPKYNHFMRDARVWDTTRIQVPLSLPPFSVSISVLP